VFAAALPECGFRFEMAKFQLGKAARGCDFHRSHGLEVIREVRQ
jgi:hypothetical protein